MCVCVYALRKRFTRVFLRVFFFLFYTRGEKSSQILTDAHRFHLIFFFFFTYSGRIAFPIGSPPKPLRSSDHLSLSVFSEATPARSCSAVRVNDAMCRPSSSHFLLYLLCSTVPLSLSHSHHPHLSLLRQWRRLSLLIELITIQHVVMLRCVMFGSYVRVSLRSRR